MNTQFDDNELLFEQNDSNAVTNQIGQNESQRSSWKNSADFNHENLQNSILVKLKHSVEQKPTFEQLMLLEQEKKHLWEILALKEEKIENMELKMLQMQNKIQLYEKQLNKNYQFIKNLQQREQKLQNQIKKMTQVRKNIIEELNLLKKSYKEQKQYHLHETYKMKDQQTQFNLSKQGSYHLKQKLYQENTLLKQEIIQLEHKNKILKDNFDEVLKQLRNIKVEMVSKFYMSGTSCENNENVRLNQIIKPEDEKIIKRFKSHRNSVQKRKRNDSTFIRSSAKKAQKQTNQSQNIILPVSTEKKSISKKIELRQLPVR